MRMYINDTYGANRDVTSTPLSEIIGENSLNDMPEQEAKYAKLPLPKRQGGSPRQDPVGAGSAEQTPREPSGGGSFALTGGSIQDARNAVERCEAAVVELLSDDKAQREDYASWATQCAIAIYSLNDAEMSVLSAPSGPEGREFRLEVRYQG
jgi:hypothetical protein